MSAGIPNLLLTGGIQHDFTAAAAALAQTLQPAGIHSTITDDLDAHWPAIQAGRWPLITLYALRWQMTQHDKYAPHRAQWAYAIPAVGRAALRTHLDRGGALLGLHTAAICFDTWPEWPVLLGAGWRWGTSHHPEPGPVRVTPTAADHPITRGLAAFDTTDEVYHALDTHTGAAPLLEVGGQPLLWAHADPGGRVVYDALGHDAAAITQPGHARILRRAARWLAGCPDSEVIQDGHLAEAAVANGATPGSVTSGTATP